MSLTLSNDDLDRLETMSRTLLSPLAATNEAAWQRDVCAQLGQFLGGDYALFRVPMGEGRFFTENGTEVVRDLMAHAQEVTPDRITYWDDASNVWHLDRRCLGIEAFNWDVTNHVVERRGLSMDRSAVWNEALRPHSVLTFAGLITSLPEGDAILWCLGPRMAMESEAQVASLRLLVPAFKAGLDTHRRLAGSLAALDVLAEPLAVFTADGRERHRNPALLALLAADPERGRVDAALAHLAADLRRLAFPRRCDGGGPAFPLRHVATAQGRYALHGALLAPGAFGPGEAFLVSVRAEVAPALPSAEAVRERHGLTGREAEVALLLAAGRSDKEVASELGISWHTARRHAEAVLGKLGVPGRSAIAARLLQRS